MSENRLLHLRVERQTFLRLTAGDVEHPAYFGTLSLHGPTIGSSISDTVQCCSKCYHCLSTSITVAAASVVGRTSRSIDCVGLSTPVRSGFSRLLPSTVHGDTSRWPACHAAGHQLSVAAGGQINLWLPERRTGASSRSFRASATHSTDSTQTPQIAS